MYYYRSLLTLFVSLIITSTAIAFEGFYANVAIGRDANKFTIKDKTDGDKFKVHADGFNGQLSVGYGYVLPQWQLYFGVELVGLLTDAQSKTEEADGGRIKIDNSHTYGAMLRVGRVFGNTLPYIKLGYGWHAFKLDSNASSDIDQIKDDWTEGGLLAGVGIAFKPLTEYQHIFVGLDYLYGNFDKGVKKDLADITPTTNQISIGIGYRI